MIELWHLGALFLLFAAYLALLVILFTRMIAALLMGLVSHIPELIRGGAAEVLENPPIPKIKLMDALSFGVVKFFQSPKFDDFIEVTMGKLGGGKKP